MGNKLHNDVRRERESVFTDKELPNRQKKKDALLKHPFHE